MTYDGKIDITFHEGEKSRPMAVFIHGLGMDKNIWTDPGKSRIMAGRFPLDVLLREKPVARTSREKPRTVYKVTAGTTPKKFNTLFHQFKTMGFHVLAWSQKRPASNADKAVNELKAILHDYSGFTHNGVILTGHSRGGIVGRSYALQFPHNIRALISIASPFRGSSLARWADIISKTLVLINPFLKNTQKGTVKNNIKHVLDFINSTAVKELLPGSELLTSLDSLLPPHIKSICIAGTHPELFSLYSWHVNCKKIDIC